jgi:transposase
MPAKKYRITLTEAERQSLREQIAAGRATAQSLMHARILLKADEGPDGPAWKDDQIVAALEISRPTVERVRRRYAETGLEATLERRPTRRVYRRKLDGEHEAHLIALACSEAPAGRSGWSLRLLAERMVALYDLDGVSYETIRRTLKKTRSNPG